MKGIWLKTEKKEYGNTENTCFTDLSWLLEITVVVPEHLSLFLFACRGYSVHSSGRVWSVSCARIAMNYQLVAGSLNAKLGKGKQLKLCVAGHIPIYFLVALVVPFQVNNDRPG